MVNIIQKFKAKLLGYWQIDDDFIMYFNSFLDNIQPYNNGIEELLIKILEKLDKKLVILEKRF